MLRSVSKPLIYAIALSAVCFVVRVDAQGAAEAKPAVTAEEVAALKAQNEALRTLIPSQSHAMMDVAYHFTNLWFAGQHQDWPLAQFYFNEARSHIQWAIRLVPVRKTSAGELKLADMFAAFDGAQLTVLNKAIAGKDRKTFNSAYRDALAGCNGCHTAAEKPYLRIVVPDQPDVHIVDMNPQASAKQ